ncbi:MAG: hypothetical protein IE913_11050, partial [Halothiobacillus sp.]|nr:hypothetical protein [Halothiobacillus sp.]
EGFRLLASQPRTQWVQSATEFWGAEETKTALAIEFQGIETSETAQDILHDTLIQLHRSEADAASKQASRQALARFMAEQEKNPKS